VFPMLSIPRFAAVVFGALPIMAAPFEQPALTGDSSADAILVRAEAGTRGDRLVVSLRSRGSSITPWTQLFLDVSDRTPAFRHPSGGPAGEGLDLLVEGESVYRFSGEGAEVWSWTPLPGVSARRSVSGDTLTLELPLDAIGPEPGRSPRAFAVTYTPDYAETLDTLPRGSATWTLEIGQTSPAVVRSSRPSARADARRAFRKITSYHCYYGGGRLEDLIARDAVIIETRAQPRENIDALRAAGRLAVGYISIGEDHDRREGDRRGPGGYDSAYFDRDGDKLPDKNPVWNSYYADARSESWRAFFLANAERMVESHGVDGFFLDTVETCLLYPESRDGMVSLIRELRRAHPEAIIVLNRGWDILPALGDVPDGLMFESFTLSYDFARKAYVPLSAADLDWGLGVWRRYLEPARRKHDLVLLSLDYVATAEDPGLRGALDRAATLGFVPCVTSIMLDAFHTIDYRGKRDRRWLAPRAK